MENKLNINYYPGHMAKALNDIKSILNLIDIVVEILDARIPISSKNYIIDDLAKNKERIVVLNKYDLADKEATLKFKKYFEDLGMHVVLTNANTGENINKLLDEIRKVGSSLEKYKNKKINIKPIYRVLIAGIPNVGKSTMINKLSKKNSLKASNRPGVTVKKQWIRAADDIELLDTPGLLWPKIDEERVGIKLALMNNIKQEVLDIESLAVEGIKIFKEYYLDLLCERYKLNKEVVLNADNYDIIELIGRKRGAMISGGNVDMEKASKMFLDDISSGKIGKITLDR